jgi:predicted amidohydrolase
MPMDRENITEIKKNLIESKDIYELIANLHVYCSDEFTDILNLLQDNHEEMFLNYFDQYKKELAGIRDGIFNPGDFPKIIGVLEKVNDSEKNEFLISIWAYLKSIDWMVPDEKINLNTMNCQSSDYFDSNKYLLLFKPRNLIFKTIENNWFEDKIKDGIDIGHRIGDYLENLILYNKNLLPGREIVIKEIDSKVDQLLLEQDTELAFAVAPIHYDYEYSFKGFKHHEGVPYIFEGIENGDKIKEYIENVLKKCREEKVHVVVLPELSIDKDLRDSISKWLRENNTEKTILMVVAGSYHVHDSNRNIHENMCIIFGFDGVPLWEQRKMSKCQLDEGDIKYIKNSSKKGLKKFGTIFNISDRSGWEKIDISKTLIIQDSSIGRMAVMICLDYLVIEKNYLLMGPNVNMIFVPSMSLTLDRFVNSNRDLGTYARASVFCANSCWVITGGECKGDVIKPEHSSYIYIPMKNGRVHLNCPSKCDCLKCNPLIFRVSKIREFLGKNKKVTDSRQSCC